MSIIQLNFRVWHWTTALLTATALSGCGGGGSGPNTDGTANRPIVFTSDRDGTSDGISDIYRMNPDGSNVRRLTNNNPINDFGGALSPDGKQIVFVSSGRAGDLTDSSQLYIMDSDGANERRLTNTVGPKFSPQWRPDGQKILFTSRQNNASDNEIFVINLDGSGATNVTNNSSDDFNAVYNGDGSKILFLAKRGNFGPRDVSNPQIWTMNADGTDPMLLPRQAGPASPDSFQFSPDGSNLLVAGGAGYMGNGESGIFIINADGSAAGARKIADSGDEAVWSPDGRLIAYVGFGDGNLEIFTVGADGRNVKRLTQNTKGDVSPSWR